MHALAVKRLVPSLVSIALGLCACERLAPTREGAAALRLNLFRVGRVELLVDSGALDAGQRAAERWEHGTGLAVTVLEIGGETAASTASGPAARVVAATFDTPLAIELGRAAGLTFAGGRLTYGALERSLDGTLVTVTFEDPARRGLPLTLVAADDAQRLAHALDELELDARPALVIESRGERVYEARLLVDGRPHPDARRDLASEGTGRPARLEPADEPLAGLRALVEDGVDVERLVAYGRRVADVQARLAAWAPVSALSGRRVRVYAYLEPGDGHALAGLLARDAGDAIDVWLVEGLADDGGAVLARELLEEALGRGGPAWSHDGAAVDAAGSWWGVELEEWCGRLAQLPARPTLDELLEDAGARSPLLVRPLRGALFRFLREQGSDGATLWRGEVEAAAVRAHADAFDAWLDELGARFAPARRTVDAEARFPLAGAAIESLPAGGAVGLGSRAAGRSLARLEELGANAALVVSSFASEAGGCPRPLEGDLALAAGLAHAGAHGNVVVLAPTLLASPTGIAWGQRVLTTTEETRAFFAAYRRFVEHAALLAELAGCEVLCLGSEMPEAARTAWTLTGPENEVQRTARPVRRAGWEGVIELARAGFDGLLTLAPGGPDKLEWFDLWERLDLVSVELFPRLDTRKRPWRPSDSAARTRIGNGLGRSLAFADGLEKPLLVLAAGFRSTELAWRGEGRDNNGGAYDGDEQARLYASLAAAVDGAREGEHGARYAGLFVWSWSSDPHAGGAGERAYTPQGKPAEAVLAEWWGDE